jgi:hypothetical protein
VAFPLSPINGQTAVLNGITYAYNSTKGAWIRVAGTVTATSVLSVTSATQSTGTTTGALVVTGGVGIGGNLYQNGIHVISNTATSTSTTTGALIVAGGVGIAGNVNIGGSVVGGGIRTTSTSTAPANPTVGDIWYNTTTDDIARYTSDGTNSYWLDITGPTVSGLTVQNTSVYANSFNGTSAYLTVPTGTAFQFGTSNFTIEAWVYNIATSANYPCVFDNRSADISTTTGILLNQTPTGYINIYYGGVNTTSGTLLAVNAWSHVCIVRNGSTLTLYQNGISVATQTGISGNLTDGRARIGLMASGSGFWNGYISNLRVVNGTAVYTANFAVPSAPLTAITNTVLLTCQGPVADASVNNFTVTNVGGVGLSLYSAQQSTAALNTNSPIILPDASQFSTAQSFGLHNRLINGAMSIDQRNAGVAQTITAAAALAYTVDRWYAYSTGANVTGQRVAGAGALQYLYQFTGAASTTGIGFGQRIEAANSYDLNNTTVTLSAFLANSLLSTVTWTAYYANTADTFGTLASPTRTQIATGSWTVSSTLARYTANIAIPAAATTGIEIVFSVGAQISGTWQIGAVQLEPGTVATPFERRPVTIEQTLSYRYYYRVTPGANNRFGAGFISTTAITYIQIPFLTTMRTKPTALETTVTAGDYYVSYLISAQISTSIPVFSSASDVGGVAAFTGSASLTAGQAAMGAAINNTAYLGWSAEL